MAMGIRCGKCHGIRTKVTNTTVSYLKWRGKRKTMVRRRRVCNHCDNVFFSLETHEEDFDDTGNESISFY